MLKCTVLICFAVLALHSPPTSGALTWSRHFAQLDNEDSAIVEVPASNKLEAVEEGPIEEEEEEKNELDEADSDSENLDLEDTDSEDAGEEESEAEDAGEEESGSEDAGEENSESEDAEEGGAGEEESESEDAGEENSESENAEEGESESEDAGEEESDTKDDDDDEDDENELVETLKNLKGEELSKALSETYELIGESLLEDLDDSDKPILEKILAENADRKWTSLDEFADFWLSTYLEIEEQHEKLDSESE